MTIKRKRKKKSLVGFDRLSKRVRGDFSHNYNVSPEVIMIIMIITYVCLQKLFN